MRVEAYAALVITAAILALASLAPAAAPSGASITIELSHMECVGNIISRPAPAIPRGEEPPTYIVGNLTPGETASFEVSIADLRRCAVAEVSGASSWFVYGGKLYVNINLKEGENRVQVKFSYTPPRKVYVTVTASNPGCVEDVSANAPVSRTPEGWVVGPWYEGDDAELSATASKECYVAGWMMGETALTTRSSYRFQASENMTLTLSAERRGERPPPSLIDFSIVSVRATGPGRVAVSTSPITGGSMGTPLWQASVNPGTVLYIEAAPEGCGELVEWRGMAKLRGINTQSLTIIAEPGYMDIEAVFREINPCPYIVVGPYRLMRVDDIPLVAAVAGGGSAGLLAYRFVTAGKKQRKTIEELMPKLSDEMLSSIASYLTGHPYGMVATMVREYEPPETPSGYVDIMKAYRDGHLAEILQDMSAYDSPTTPLLKIAEYSTLRLERAALQGHLAGRLLTAYLTFRGYAPATREVLHEWVRRMKPISSREDAEYNMELLWTDEALAGLQRRAVDAIMKELSRQGLDSLVQYPPRPFQKVLETLEVMKCPRCGSKVIEGMRYCPQCGSRLLATDEKPAAVAALQERPATAEVRRPKPQKLAVQEPPAHEEMRPAMACPHCGAKLQGRAKYCTRCGANLSATATKSDGRALRELVARARETVTEAPAPEKRVTAKPAVPAEGEAPPQPKPDQRKAVEELGAKERQLREVKTVEETTKPAPEKPAAEEVAKTWPAEAAETVKQTPMRPTQPPSPPGPEAARAEEAHTPPAPPESQEEPTEVEWEPDRDSLELLKNMEIPVEDFRREAFRLARISEEDRAFERELMRSANRLASLVEGLDENFKVQLMMSLSQHLRDAAFVVRKELRPPKPQKPEAGKPLEKAPQEPAEVAEPPKPKPERAPEITQPPRPVEPTKPPRPIEEAKAAESPKPPAKPDKEKPLTEIDYGVLLEEGAEAGHVYILDLPRSAVPTAMVTRVRNTVNVEVSTGAGPDAVLALTRTTYRANYKSMVRPSPNHPYVRRLEKLVSSGAGGGVITTAEIYEMLNGAFAARGFKPVMVRLDTGRIAERLKQAGGEQVAGRLAKLFALMPEALDIFLSGGVEGLRKHFQNLLGQEDGEELFQAVRAVVSGDLRYVNKPLMMSLGMLDEAG